MQPEEFLQLIKQPNLISAQKIKGLEDLVAQHPYFQIALALLAKAAYDHAPDTAQTAIQHAAIYATDRQQLKLLLESPLIPKALESATSDLDDPHIPPLQPMPTTAEVSEPDFINSYINTIRRKQIQRITKRKSLEQLNIIENFIQQGGQFSSIHIKNTPLDANQIDLSQESTTLQDDLVTESLAQVMIKQGKFQRALDIYNKLQAKFPEKKSYFSVLSQELKKEIE
jgi:tetratricopeptide (TPR) repeat protein